MSGGSFDLDAMYIKELEVLTYEEKKAIGKLISAMRDRRCFQEFTNRVNSNDTSSVAKLLAVIVQRELPSMQ